MKLEQVLNEMRQIEDRIIDLGSQLELAKAHRATLARHHFGIAHDDIASLNDIVNCIVRVVELLLTKDEAKREGKGESNVG